MDASKAAVRFVIEFGRLVAFGGCKLNERETKYLVTELEHLTIMEALKGSCPYLLGTKFSEATVPCCGSL